MNTEANRKAAAKYKQKAIVRKVVEFNRNTDMEMIEYLKNDSEPFSTKIKRLLRAEMESKK